MHITSCARHIIIAYLIGVSLGEVIFWLLFSHHNYYCIYASRVGRLMTDKCDNIYELADLQSVYQVNGKTTIEVTKSLSAEEIKIFTVSNKLTVKIIRHKKNISTIVKVTNVGSNPELIYIGPNVTTHEIILINRHT